MSAPTPTREEWAKVAEGLVLGPIYALVVLLCSLVFHPEPVFAAAAVLFLVSTFWRSK